MVLCCHFPICKSRRCRIQFSGFEQDVFQSFQINKRQGQFNQFCNFVIWFRVKSVDPAENNIIVRESEEKKTEALYRSKCHKLEFLPLSIFVVTHATNYNLKLKLWADTEAHLLFVNVTYVKRAEETRRKSETFAVTQLWICSWQKPGVHLNFLSFYTAL